MDIKLAKQGFYNDQMNGTTPENWMTWQPDAGANYLVMVQSTVTCGKADFNSASVEFNLVDDNGNQLLDGTSPNTAGAQTVYAKCSSGGPSTLPMAYLCWQAPDSPPTSVYVTLTAVTPDGAGSPSRLQSGIDNLSITVIEVDGLPDL